MLYDLSGTPGSHQSIETSVCVIGAGPAGLLAAKKLSDAGKPVIVLESGGVKPNSHFKSLNNINIQAATYKRAIDGRVRSLGGTSTVWGGCLLPLAEHDFEKRDYIGLEAWPITKNDIAHYQADIEKIFGVDSTSYEDDIFSSHHLSKNLPRSAYGLTTRWPKFPTFKNYNVADILKDDIYKSRQLDVWTNATVYDFDINVLNGRVVSVSAKNFNGKTLTIFAENFIIACGTLEATRLLLLLDRKVDQGFFSKYNILGHYFHDHLKIVVGRLCNRETPASQYPFMPFVVNKTRRGLHFETSFEMQKRLQIGSGYLTMTRRVFDTPLSDNSNDLIYKRFIDFKTETRNCIENLTPKLYWNHIINNKFMNKHSDIVVEMRVEQVPTFSSTVSLSESKDALGIPELQLHWLRTSEDEKTMRAVIQMGKEYWDSMSFSRAWPINWFLDQNLCDDLIEISEDTCHPAGSARMGNSPSNSVVGRDLRCHAVQNLLVASAAVFPTSGSANPTMTVMQIAALAADNVIYNRFLK